MLFSSLLFLYLFLPLLLLSYYLIPTKFKNLVLLLFSLVFFAWGGVSNTVILIASIILNYFFGRAIQSSTGARAKLRLIAGLSINIALLIVFKYSNFLTSNLNYLLEASSCPVLPDPGIVLPVGISFYTFHLISYLVDIYRGKTEAQKNILDLSLYVSMFSQLIAGPIIRYSDVWQQLKERSHTLIKFTSGIEKFLIGLAKKVLLANVFAGVADKIFNSDPTGLSAANAWLGLLCYSLQIYCDFSGYSDMAIGLGRMFGFEFLENFNFPYMAKSVKDFWRRWHISLSTFFRDYVYIPLGGNQVKVSRVYLNLIIVFFLTGFWHGASWTFVVWGLMHGLFMILERLGLEKVLQKAGSPFSNIYTLFVVMMAWVLFRAPTFDFAIKYWSALFNVHYNSEQASQFMNALSFELCLAFAIALAGAFGWMLYLVNYLHRLIQKENPVSQVMRYFYHTVSVFAYAVILILCSLYLISGTYNPFIYYQF